MRRRKQAGQALILVVVGVGLVLAGAMGLAIDTSQLYGQRQMAQAAADSAAQAGIMTIFSGTVSNTTLNTSAYSCTNGTDTTTPCYYARKNGFATTTTSTDSIAISYPNSVPGVANLSTDFSPNIIHVLISRPVKATFLGMLGAGATTVKASATAAILTASSPVSIAVLHPNLTSAAALQLGDANTTVLITGGPQRAVQVNSRAATAFSANANSDVDLSTAGPNGTGADFGSFGGPSSAGSWLNLGTTGHFVQPNPPVQDPFRNVPVPTDPGTGHMGVVDKTSAATFACQGDCPMSAATANKCSNAAAGDCWIYNPGHYDNMTNLGQSPHSYAIFEPGLYWVNSGGFQASSGGNVTLIMCGQGATFGAPGGTCNPVPAWETSGCCDTNNRGMLVYLNGGNISMGSNAVANLYGADASSVYKDILFFNNRSSTNTATHSLGGGAIFSLTGSTYATNCTTTPCNITTQYQTIQFTGGGASNTTLNGEIITDQLILKGGGTIKMNLSALFSVVYDYVSLVQ
jgi:hypothetical protein